MGKFRVVVGGDGLKPLPFVRGIRAEKGDQAVGEHLAQLIRARSPEKARRYS